MCSLSSSGHLKYKQNTRFFDQSQREQARRTFGVVSSTTEMYSARCLAFFRKFFATSFMNECLTALGMSLPCGPDTEAMCTYVHLCELEALADREVYGLGGRAEIRFLPKEPGGPRDPGAPRARTIVGLAGNGASSISSPLG